MTSAARRTTPIVPRLVADEVYERLLSLVIDGEVEPEERLSVDGLARDLGVSSSPVREALARLEATGLVRRFALRGYRVAPILSADELGELFEARLVIEPPAATAVAIGRPDGLTATLTHEVGLLREAPRGDRFASFRDYLQADHRFHLAIVDGTGNRFLAAAYGALGGPMQRFRLFSGRGVTDAEATIAEHTAILRAIDAGEPDAASAAMQAHLRGVQHRALGDLQG